MRTKTPILFGFVIGVGTLTALLAGPGCGWQKPPRSETFDTASTVSEMLPLPEYDPGQAIVLHMAGAESFAPKYLQPLMQELLDMGFPRIVIIDDAPDDKFTAARAQLEELFQSSQLARKRIVVSRLVNDAPGGRFIRDWLGMPLSDGKTFEVMDFSYFQGGDVTQEMLF